MPSEWAGLTQGRAWWGQQDLVICASEKATVFSLHLQQGNTFTCAHFCCAESTRASPRELCFCGIVTTTGAARNWLTPALCISRAHMHTRLSMDLITKHRSHYSGDCRMVMVQATPAWKGRASVECLLFVDYLPAWILSFFWSSWWVCDEISGSPFMCLQEPCGQLANSLQCLFYYCTYLMKLH